jgi:Spy/CpxP family protein refolding chaperone
MLGALKLDEAQADKVFEILHAQAPAVRSATKTLRKANDELRALALSESYDAAKARTLADAASRAMGELALMRADADHRIWSVLTAEQRRRAEALPRPPKTLDE